MYWRVVEAHCCILDSLHVVHEGYDHVEILASFAPALHPDRVASCFDSASVRQLQSHVVSAVVEEEERRHAAELRRDLPIAMSEGTAKANAVSAM